MDFFTALRVSASALGAQRARVNVATSNLANAESTRTAEGGPYRRRDPVLRAVPFPDPGGADPPVSGVAVEGIVEDPTPGRRVYSPGHPDADPGGFVTLPNVNPIQEVVNLVSASRGYEANAAAVETLKQMALRALDIAR